MKRFVVALELASKTRSRLTKVRGVGEALAALAGPDRDLATATRLASGRTLPARDGRTLGVGGSLLFEVAATLTGQPPEILAMCARATGDLPEAFGLLASRDPAAAARPGLTFAELADAFDALARTGVRAHKRRALDDLFARATPLEIKFVGRALFGDMRIGAQEGVLEEAVAQAFGAPLEAVRRAAALVTDLGEVAVLARAGRLADASLEVRRPVAFMLASPIETVKAPIGSAARSRWIAEDKIDGVRAQVHRDEGGEVVIFARGSGRVTVAYPDLADTFARIAGRWVLDGEIVVLGEGGRPRPFQVLQSRLRKTAPNRRLLATAPVTFCAYDVLFDGESLLARPWRERRARLEGFAARADGSRLVIHPFHELTDAPLDPQLDALFAAARARGHEGLVLKTTDAPYEAGRRGQSWLKVKRAFATLDVVMTAAQVGTGRRAGTLSDYTFAVWRSGELVNVGKAYSGLADDEIAAVGRRIETLTVERHGGTRVVRPEIVLEVGFDGVQRSKRHKSGFALRFPRILRVRDDKTAEQADTVEAVEALFQAQLATGHREELAGAEVPARRQLSLFGD